MSRERVESVVEAFIASYRRAFERGDPEAILGHFGKSVHLVSDTGTDVRAELLTRAEWRRTVEQLVSRYRTLGVGRIELRALDTTGLSERLVQTRVTWRSSTDVETPCTSLVRSTRSPVTARRAWSWP
jgi:hypothetical protein